MTTETTSKIALSSEYHEAMDSYLKALNEHPEHTKHNTYFELNKGINAGLVYDKIVQKSYGQKSVFCFVDRRNGDLLKAASWKTPAKGKRGSIFQENPPLLGGQFYRVQ